MMGLGTKVIRQAKKLERRDLQATGASWAEVASPRILEFNLNFIQKINWEEGKVRGWGEENHRESQISSRSRS